jgi:hypothetical protein
MSWVRSRVSLIVVTSPIVDGSSRAVVTDIVSRVIAFARMTTKILKGTIIIRRGTGLLIRHVSFRESVQKKQGEPEMPETEGSEGPKCAISKKIVLRLRKTC